MAQFIDAYGLTTVIERVRFIIGLMRANEWLLRRSERAELCGIWGISHETLKGYAAEASRAMQLDPEELVQARAELAHRLLDVANRAKASINILTGQPDLRAELDALRTYAEFVGIDLSSSSGPAQSGPAVTVILNCDDGVPRAAPMDGDESK